MKRINEQDIATARMTCEALDAGMPLRSARRWPQYVAMRAEQGRKPIPLDVAVAQCLIARSRPRT